MKPPALLTAFVALVAAVVGLGLASSAWAGQLGTDVPTQCTPHGVIGTGGDAPDDYRCAGLSIRFHTGGAGASPFPIWAGQWLFRDEEGQFRVGTCTLNRGVHPTTATPSQRVTQQFPNDPTGAKGAYLAWRHGDTTDPLEAAAVWAVFHHYALDAAGSNRSLDPGAPLVPRLDTLGASSGRADLQDLAVRLDAEAQQFSGQWALALAADPSGVVTATLTSGGAPVPGREIAVLVGGVDTPLAATTGTDGTATVTAPLPQGAVTVVATAESPGPVLVYRGTPALPDGSGAQTLVTAGPPVMLRAEATLETAVPPETVPPETVPPETVPPETVPPETVPPATVPPATVPPATVPPETVPPETVPVGVASPTPTVPPATVPPTPTVPAPGPSLPRTGALGDGGLAWLATAFVVGGAGLLGTLRRREEGRVDCRG